MRLQRRLPGAAAFGVLRLRFLTFPILFARAVQAQQAPNFNELVGRLESTLAKVYQNKEL
jgi:hypothetical protein